jgi:diguanylate cyclase (GGDEF)-like protein
MDTVVRLGGDEFVVLASDVSHFGAVDLGNRLVVELGRFFDRVEGGERVTVSVGIAVSVGGRGTAEFLLKEADTAMYLAKSLG